MRCGGGGCSGERADPRQQDAGAPSVFRPENLLREARRQRGVPEVPVPEVCLLDPDGDIVRQLRAHWPGAAGRRLGLLPHRARRFTLGGETRRRRRLRRGGALRGAGGRAAVRLRMPACSSA